MTNTFTIDSMRNEIDSEFKAIEVTLPSGNVVTLRSLLRIPKVNREKCYKLIDQLQELNKEEDESLKAAETQSDIALQMLPLVASTPELGQELVEAVEDDLPLLMKLFTVWMESTQAGEAQGSEG